MTRSNLQKSVCIQSYNFRGTGVLCGGEVQQQAAGLAAGARSWEFTSSESGKLHKQGEAVRLQACPSYTLLSKASSPDPSQAVPLGPKSSNICIYGRHFSFIPPQLFFLFPKKQTLLYILYSCPVSSQRFLLLHLIVLQDLGFFFSFIKVGPHLSSLAFTVIFENYIFAMLGVMLYIVLAT